VDVTADGLAALTQHRSDHLNTLRWFICWYGPVGGAIADRDAVRCGGRVRCCRILSRLRPGISGVTSPGGLRAGDFTNFGR
jgi:hypothetical protein